MAKKLRPKWRGMSPQSSTAYAVCPKCDKILNDLKDCSNCGTKIDWELEIEKGVFKKEILKDGNND